MGAGAADARTHIQTPTSATATCGAAGQATFAKGKSKPKLFANDWYFSGSMHVLGEVEDVSDEVEVEVDVCMAWSAKVWSEQQAANTEMQMANISPATRRALQLMQDVAASGSYSSDTYHSICVDLAPTFGNAMAMMKDGFLWCDYLGEMDGERYIDVTRFLCSSGFALLERDFFTDADDGTKRRLVDELIEGTLGVLLPEGGMAEYLMDRTVLPDASGPLHNMRQKCLEGFPGIVYCFEKVTKDYDVFNKFTPFTNSTSSGVMPNQVKILLFYESDTVALTLGHQIGQHDRATIKVSAQLDLQDFPFDRQLLPFTFDSRLPHPCESPPHGLPARWANPCKCTIDAKLFAKSQFRYYPPKYVRKADGTMSLCIGLERMLHQFKWNFFIPIFVTTMLTSMGLLLPATDLNDRLGLNITLLLTVAAFNLSVKRPNVSYLTFSEVYVGVSEALICFACAESCLGYWMVEQSQGAEEEGDVKANAHIDTAYLAMLFGLWGGYHMILAIDMCGWASVIQRLPAWMKIRRPWLEVVAMQDYQAPPVLEMQVGSASA